ncbi:MAG: HDOD domain-containing protein [Dehalococcoidia bacterium]|nr:HDOD domain-containing protein [Dehalococcoidia bacterium]
MPQVETFSVESVAQRVTGWRPLPPSLYALLALRQHEPDADARLVEIVGGDSELNRRMLVLGSVSTDVEGKGRSAAGAAIRQIGYRRVHCAAVAVLLVDSLAAGANEFDFLDYWRNAAACAGLAASIADVARSEARDLAYTAGLLHRVGLLALDMAAPDRLAILRDAVAEQGWSEPLEESVLGFTIREVTAALLVKWRLPMDLAEAHLVRNEPTLWESRPVASLLWDASNAMSAIGIPDPLHGAAAAPGATVSHQARLVLDRYYEGGSALLRRSEGLIGACLLACDEDRPSN